MTMRWMNNIFVKLFVTYLVILILSYGVFSVVSSLLIENDLEKNLQRRILADQERAARYLIRARQQGWDREMIVSSLELTLDRHTRAYLFYDDEDRLLYQVGRVPPGFQADRNLLRQAGVGRPVVGEMKNMEEKPVLSVIAIDGTLEEQKMMAVTHGFRRDFNRILFLFLLVGAVVMSVSGICLYIVSRKISSPLKEMNEIALDFAKGKLDRRVRVRSRDEIGQLGESLNYMAKELAGLEQMRRDFLANVSHDLRTPLTSIHGFVQALLDGTIPAGQQRRYLSAIREATLRLKKLVDDLLEMARMESGELKLHPVRFNLSEQLRRVIARMEPQFSRKKLEVAFEQDRDTDIFARADPDRIDQVMVNLLQNAVQFSAEGNRVEVRLSVRDRIYVTVEDQGSGMKPEELQRIWERFYKGDKARSQNTGTGLGLSIVKHLLDLHGSRIQVESSWKRGTRFTFTLSPANERNQKPDES